MPDPYQVSYSFAGFQATSPNTPLPAIRLDDELANVAAAIDALVDALAEVRRVDGKLGNDTVGMDQLDDQVLALFDEIRTVTTFDLSPTVFATQMDAEAGAANDRLMTPLRVAQALNALRAFASVGEAQAGSATGVVMSPLRTKQYVDTRILTGTASLTFSAIAAGASGELTIAVTGAAVGDAVAIGPPAGGPTAGLIPSAWVSAADTVTVRLTNITAGSLTPTASQTWRATVVKGA